MASCVVRTCRNVFYNQAIGWGCGIPLNWKAGRIASPEVIQLLFERQSSTYGVPKLSPQEVSSILRVNEMCLEVNTSSVRAFDANQLPSNSPIEDRIAVSRCRLTTGMLFGVFDGHGGADVADIVSQRLFDYIAVSLLAVRVLKEIVESDIGLSNLLVETFDEQGLSAKLRQIHNASLMKYATEILQSQDINVDFNMQQALIQSFIKLDSDLSEEIQDAAKKDIELLSLAVMGACACIAHIDGSHLHLATAGDCKAVLGILSDNNKWISKPLTTEHNTDNVTEIKRVLSEHPKSETNSIIKNERLLGQLAPLRAFADYPYKWKSSLQKKLLAPAFGSGVVPPNYYTPPYLTARPEVVHHRLTPRDRFLIIASDGLWEQMLPHKVVKFVGEHMSGKQTLDLLKLPRKQMQLKGVNEILLQREIGLSKKPLDANAATHLIRNALGRTEYGIEHSKLSAMLSLPDDLVRNFRDDISVIVVFFDTDYLRHSPAE